MSSGEKNEHISVHPFDINLVPQAKFVRSLVGFEKEKAWDKAQMIINAPGEWLIVGNYILWQTNQEMFSPQNLVFMQNMFWLKWIRDAIRKGGIIWREKFPK